MSAMSKFFHCALAVTGILCMSASCGDEPSFESYSSEKSFPVSDESGNRIEFKINVEYPVAGLAEPAMSNICKTLTSSIFGEKFSGLPVNEAISAYENDRTADYRKANLPLAEELGDRPAASLDWSDYITGAAGGCHKNILSYSITKYSFTGGAHGMTAESALNFDMKTGNLLTESGFFKEGYKDRLSELLSSRLAESLENPSDTSMLFTQEIGPNGNFTAGEEGVTYIYNQYEIGPYAMGIIRVTLPWEDIEGLY